MTTETVGLTGIAALEAEMRDRLSAKDAEIKRLREAMAPFADCYAPPWKDGREVVDIAYLRLEHWREARSAYLNLSR